MKKELIFLLALLAGSVFSFGQWNHNTDTGAIAVCSTPHSAFNKFSVQDGAGGSLTFFVMTNMAGTADTLAAQHITKDGLLSWGTHPSPVVINIPADQIKIFGASYDNNGGAYVVWGVTESGNTCKRLFAQHINLTGDISWADTGMLVTEDTSKFITEVNIACDRNSNLTISWQLENYVDFYSEIFVKKYDVSGNAIWGDGIRLNTAHDKKQSPRMVMGNDGACIISYTLVTVINGQEMPFGRNVIAQKIDSAGNFQWGTWGKFVSVAPYNELNINIVSDSAGGAFIFFRNYADVFTQDTFQLRCQYLNNNGDRVWPDSGILICSRFTGNYDWHYSSSCNDGAGGVVVTTFEKKPGTFGATPYVRRILPGGTFAWDSAICLSVNGEWAQGMPIKVQCHQDKNYLCIWEDSTLKLRGQKLSADGRTMWERAGTVISSRIQPVGYDLVLSNNLSAIATWGITGNISPYAGEVRAAKIDLSGSLYSSYFYITVRVGDWNEPGTWQNGSVPPADADIIVKHTVTVSTNTVCNTLQVIPPHGSITVNSGTDLTVIH